MTEFDGFSTLEFLNHANSAFSNEKLCEWTQAQVNEYKTLLSAFEQSNGRKSTATRAEKGQALEEIASFLINNCGPLFTVDRNIRTCTNEIDNLMKLTSAGKLLQKIGILPSYYTNFIGECKNYSATVGVTYIGKFCSLMLTTSCNLGILFSYHGVTGHGWNDGSGLIRKFYLHKENPSDRYCIIDFNIKDFRSVLQGNNILQIIDDKISSLKFDTDYSTSLSTHPAESDFLAITN